MPQPFGWKYLHFIGPEGQFLNVILHKGHITGSDELPYASATGNLPNIGRLRMKVPIESTDFDFSNPNKLIGSVESWTDGPKRKVSIGDEKKSLTIEYSRSLDFLFLGEAELMRLPENAQLRNFWVVDCIQNDAVLDITLDDIHLHLKGRVYVDRQWGDLSIASAVSFWEWAHVAFPTHAIVFFDITMADGSKSCRAYSVSEAGIQLSQKALISVSGNTVLVESDIADDIVFSRSPEDCVRSRLERIGNKRLKYERWMIHRKDKAIPFFITSERMQFSHE